MIGLPARPVGLGEGFTRLYQHPISRFKNTGFYQSVSDLLFPCPLCFSITETNVGDHSRESLFV